jgi:UDP-2-acetamido-3-amino-2,3-dideoxy-glucuronate N-acetyltransferase
VGQTDRNPSEFDRLVRLIEFGKVDEPRGTLVEFDYGTLPFVPRRTFVVMDVPPGTERGGHAHKECEQVLVCLEGRVVVSVVAGDRRTEVVLDRPANGLYVGAGVWARQRYEAAGTRLLVFASLPFRADSYIERLD